MREYRLMKKRTGNYFYPQVRELKCLFQIWNISIFPYKTDWQRIIVHQNGFGLYKFDDYCFGETWVEAKKIITDYEEQFICEEQLPYVYSLDSQASIRYDIEKRNNAETK